MILTRGMENAGAPSGPGARPPRPALGSGPVHQGCGLHGGGAIRGPSEPAFSRSAGARGPGPGPEVRGPEPGPRV